MNYNANENLNPPEETIDQFPYWKCTGCGDKFSNKSEIAVLHHLDTDEVFCKDCIKESMPDMLENDDVFNVHYDFPEPDGYEELTEIFNDN